MENKKFKDIYNDKYRITGYITKTNYDKIKKMQELQKSQRKAYSQGAILDLILNDYFNEK